MFGFGITEIITVIIVIIVLVNPKDLPVIVRKIGKLYASVMKQINAVRKGFTSFEEELRTASDLSVHDSTDEKSSQVKKSETPQTKIFKTVKN